MPEGPLHRKVVMILKEGLPGYEIYKTIYDGNVDPILISYTRGRHKRSNTIPYQPDLYADHTAAFGRGRDVFEVLDTESIWKALMDIVNFSIMPNHCHLRMICLSQPIFNKLEDRYEILLKKLGMSDDDLDDVSILLLRKGKNDVMHLRRRLMRLLDTTYLK